MEEDGYGKGNFLLHHVDRQHDTLGDSRDVSGDVKHVFESVG